MSDVFQGAVIADQYQVKVAIENYTKELTEAKAVSEALKKKAKEDILGKRGWFGIPTHKTIWDWIQEDIYDSWFRTWVDYLPQYYPKSITDKQLDLINGEQESTYWSVVAMYNHNCLGMYLSSSQASWVNRWSK